MFATVTESDPRPVRVLAVEDDRLSRVLIEETLSDFNAVELTTATTVADGVLLLASQLVFDVVLLDWRLDGRPAQTILDVASLLPPHRRPRVVLVTGSILPDEIRNLVPQQIDRILMKPIELEDLLEVVLGAAREHRSGGAVGDASMSA